MGKVTIEMLIAKKNKSEKITMLTAYDHNTAKVLDEAGIDVILVGDSLGMVALGYGTTLPVTIDEMMHHTKAVSRGVLNAFVVGDMPFMTYQTSVNGAVRNAGRFLKEAGANAVKLEGGKAVCAKIEAMVSAGIPVMGHLGVTPQSVNIQSGYKLQGKTEESADQIYYDALALQEAGAFAVVLECVPAKLAKRITDKLDIPTIGIGAGLDCDGQVLVTDDLLGKSDKVPKFVNKYMDYKGLAAKAVQSYIKDVEKGNFPKEDNWS